MLGIVLWQSGRTVKPVDESTDVNSSVGVASRGKTKLSWQSVHFQPVNKVPASHHDISRSEAHFCAELQYVFKPVAPLYSIVMLLSHVVTFILRVGSNRLDFSGV